MGTADQDQLSQFEKKLQGFYDSLEAGEKSLLRDLPIRGSDEPLISETLQGTEAPTPASLGSAELPQDPGRRSSDFRPTITIGGKTVTLSVGGSTTNPDREKDGATTASQRGGSQSGDSTRTGKITLTF